MNEVLCSGELITMCTQEDIGMKHTIIILSLSGCIPDPVDPVDQESGPDINNRFDIRNYQAVEDTVGTLGGTWILIWTETSSSVNSSTNEESRQSGIQVNSCSI